MDRHGHGRATCYHIEEGQEGEGEEPSPHVPLFLLLGLTPSWRLFGTMWPPPPPTPALATAQGCQNSCKVPTVGQKPTSRVGPMVGAAVVFLNTMHWDNNSRAE